MVTIWRRQWSTTLRSYVERGLLDSSKGGTHWSLLADAVAARSAVFSTFMFKLATIVNQALSFNQRLALMEHVHHMADINVMAALAHLGVRDVEHISFAFLSYAFSSVIPCRLEHAVTLADEAFCDAKIDAPAAQQRVELFDAIKKLK